jgi:hypothetical protein
MGERTPSPKSTTSYFDKIKRVFTEIHGKKTGKFFLPDLLAMILVWASFESESPIPKFWFSIPPTTGGYAREINRIRTNCNLLIILLIVFFFFQKIHLFFGQFAIGFDHVRDERENKKLEADDK